MRRILLTLCLSVFVAGCQSAPIEDEVLINQLPDQLYSYYKNTNLQIQYPKGFSVKTKQQIANQFSNSVDLLIESDKKGANMQSVIMIESFSVPTNSEINDLIDAFYMDNESKLINFNEKPSELYNTVVNGEYFQSEIKHFSGRRTLGGNDIEFLQTYLVFDNKLIMGTAAFDPIDPFVEADSLRESLKTLTIF